MTEKQIETHRRSRKMIKAAILGYGTVGSGVYEVIKRTGMSSRAGSATRYR